VLARPNSGGGCPSRTCVAAIVEFISLPVAELIRAGGNEIVGWSLALGRLCGRLAEVRHELKLNAAYECGADLQQAGAQRPERTVRHLGIGVGDAVEFKKTILATWAEPGGSD
jgi:hypothetical protein